MKIGQRDDEAARERIATWQSLYESTYRDSRAVDPAFDITGWHSSYTGLPIPDADMREWVEATVARISRRRPRRILEIGVGTGLLLFRLAPHCERYVGLDFSAVALATLDERVRAAGLSGVELQHSQAEALCDFPPDSFDAVVLNSIVQYFPGADHLIGVLERAITLVTSGGIVFVGDVRSLPLQQTFNTSVELHRAPSTLSVAQFENRVRAAALREEELLVAPALFAGFQQDARIADVCVLMKRGRRHNELTAFRYDVTIEKVTPSAAGVSVTPGWLDWEDDGMTLDGLSHWLRVAVPDNLLLRNIPNARLWRETRARTVLADSPPDRTVGSVREALLAEVGDDARPGVRLPVDVEVLAERVGAEGYELDPLWMHHGPDGRFDGRLRRASAASVIAGRVPDARLRPGPARNDAPRSVGRERLRHTNDPLQFSIGRRVIPDIRRTLRARLPEQMLPASFVFLESFPLTPNGKIDRDALPDPAVSRDGVDGDYVAPRTPVEEVIAGFWSELLATDTVGVRDNFFELGGHSLLGMQLVARVRDAFRIDLPISTLFDAPTVEGLAAALAEQLPSRGELEQRAIWTLALARMSDDEVARRLSEGRTG